MIKNHAGSLAGLLILVVEDEVMVSMMLEDMLKDFGCRVALAGTTEEAMKFLRQATPDGVLLDMNLHGKQTDPVAEELSRRLVPFLLVTGYSVGENDPPVMKAAPRLQKPFSEDNLEQRLAEVFVTARQSPTQTSGHA